MFSTLLGHSTSWRSFRRGQSRPILRIRRRCTSKMQLLGRCRGRNNSYGDACRQTPPLIKLPPSISSLPPWLGVITQPPPFLAEREAESGAANDSVHRFPTRFPLKKTSPSPNLLRTEHMDLEFDVSIDRCIWTRARFHTYIHTHIHTYIHTHTLLEGNTRNTLYKNTRPGRV